MGIQIKKKIALVVTTIVIAGVIALAIVHQRCQTKNEQPFPLPPAAGGEGQILNLPAAYDMRYDPKSRSFCTKYRWRLQSWHASLKAWDIEEKEPLRTMLYEWEIISQ